MRTLLVALLLVIGGIVVFKLNQPVVLPPETVSATPLYEGVGEFKPHVSLFAENIAQITQIEITPDANSMLVGTLQGTIHVFQRIDGVWRRQKEPFFTLQTAQPGFPPEEAGLTGIVLGADFSVSGDVFLNYSYAFAKDSFRNRVTRVTFARRGKKVIGVDPVQIFEANTPGAGSHQIQDGVGVLITGKPHLLFGIGEGFVAQRALDPGEEAGKVLLLQRDGSDPVGTRPYPDHPKVQAIGVRNPPAIALNPATEMVALGDTGPSNFDRFLYGKLVRSDGQNSAQISFNWNGEESSLQRSAFDPNNNNQNMVLHLWQPTDTPVSIILYENKKLPKLATGQQYVLVTLFGQTGSTANTPGKTIMLGTLSSGSQNSLTLKPFIERSPEGEGKLGHPMALAADPTTDIIYFSDIMEGRIYQAEIE